MKTIITQKSNSPYPCFKRYSEELRKKLKRDFVILFTSPKEGTVVATDDCASSHYIGEQSDTWSEEAFEPFTGTIEISD